MPGPSDSLADELPSADPVRPHESDRVSADLRERMERLPPNHPSSPYNADGSRKPPEPRSGDREFPIPGDPDYRPGLPGASDAAEVSEPVTLATDPSPRGDTDTTADTGPDRDSATAADANPDRDQETVGPAAQPEDAPPGIEPLTDAEYANHVQEVRQRIEEAQSKDMVTYKEYTLDRRGEVWVKERTTHHLAIINTIYEGAVGVPTERHAIIAGGLPGAGKTTVLERYAGIDRSQFLTINPDDIKEEMARRGLTPHVEGLSPMEASDLIHEESSYIAKRLANVAQTEGKNIIWDITMLSRSTTERRIDELRTNGYNHIEGVFVDIPSEVCKTRAEARHRIGLEEYRAGKGEGGRLIPDDLIDSSRNPTWGSASRKTFEEVKHRFDRWTVYDNSADGLPPVLTHSSEIEKRGQ